MVIESMMCEGRTQLLHINQSIIVKDWPLKQRSPLVHEKYKYYLSPLAHESTNITYVDNKLFLKLRSPALE